MTWFDSLGQDCIANLTDKTKWHELSVPEQTAALIPSLSSSYTPGPLDQPPPGLYLGIAHLSFPED